MTSRPYNVELDRLTENRSKKGIQFYEKNLTIPDTRPTLAQYKLALELFLQFFLNQSYDYSNANLEAPSTGQ